MQNTYLGASTYYYYFNCCSYVVLTNYVVNRLLKTTARDSASVVHTPVQNLYDGAGYATQLGPSGFTCSGGLSFSGYGYREMDPSPPFAALRGLLTQTSTPAVTRCMGYDGFGNLSSESGSDGSSLSVPVDSSVNYAAPTSLTTESYNYSVGYNAWLGMGSSTGANGEHTTMSYDSYGRPQASTSPFTYYGMGEVVYSYPTSAVLPTWQWKTGEDGYTYTLLDGVGRASQVKRGPSTGPQSFTNSVYAPCACSPMGKLQKTSQPIAATSGIAWGSPDTATPSAWTSYTYDGIGRTLSVTLPDGVSTTTYSYSGNQTTVTDPAGNWKKFATDVMGNLISVTEPDPANLPSGTVTTSYAYDWMNHLISSTMTRGSVTQTRTFVYNDAGQLTSATNPENGAVTYTYNTNGALGSKTDANGTVTGYSYDSANRLTSVAVGSDDCQAVSYTYGTDQTVYNYSRPLTITYGTMSHTCVSGTLPTSYQEQYTYTYAGAVSAKTLWVNRNWTDWNGDPETLTDALTVAYGYDAWGNVLGVTYPGSDPFASSGSTVNMRYTLDPMGRLSGASDGSGGPVWVQGVTYDLAGRMTQMQYPQYSSTFNYITESKAYNTNGELATMTWTPGGSGGSGIPSGTLSYGYTGTGHSGNNGQIVSVTDGVSGETISYQYDVLKRLTSASSSPISGTTPAAWSQNYSYDGFGNLTSRVSGTTTIPVDPATNRLTNAAGVLAGVSYDSNGNLLSAGSLAMTYDGANRVLTATVGSGTEYYGYDPNGKRMYRKLTGGSEEFTLYGVDGKKLGTFAETFDCTDWSDPTTCYDSHTMLTTNVWFGGKLLWSGAGSSGSGPDFTDHLGTNRGNGARFYPYGDEITSTSNDRVKFATYERSSVSGLDYAQARYYASVYGRFTSPDFDFGSAILQNPGSWNRYAYVSSDPVNNNDPSGLNEFNNGCSYGIDFCATGFGSSGVSVCMIDPELCSPWGTGVENVGIEGGGGSTQGGGGGMIIVRGWTSTSAAAIGVQNTLRWIQAQIVAYPTCDDWLKGNFGTINTILGQDPLNQTDLVGVGTFAANADGTVTNALAGTAGSNIALGAADLTINLNGAYYNSGVPVSSLAPGITGGSYQAQLFILLHELAHLTGAANFQDGDNNKATQDANNGQLLNNCGDFIASVPNSQVPKW